MNVASVSCSAAALCRFGIGRKIGIKAPSAEARQDGP